MITAGVQDAVLCQLARLALRQIHRHYDQPSAIIVHAHDLDPAAKDGLFENSAMPAAVELLRIFLRRAGKTGMQLLSGYGHAPLKIGSASCRERVCQYV